MGGWYTVGVAAGLATAIGALVAGVIPRLLVAAVLAAAGGVVIGIAVYGWPEAVGGLVGGALGGVGATPVVSGALRRGGTRGGVAAIVAGAAAATAGLAFVPVLGYLEAVGLPLVAARLRRREPERHAGLRTLARD